MIKRPLVWVLGAYLLGILAAWYQVGHFIILLSIILLIIFVYLMMYRIKNQLIHHKDYFLWSLPLFLLLGFYAMTNQVKLPEIDGAFAEKAECTITGKITMVVEKQWGKALYVTNNTIFLTRQEPYLCENVIIYVTESQVGRASSDQPYDQEQFYRDSLDEIYDRDSSNIQVYRVGNLITAKGKILKFSEAGNPGQFNEKMYYQIENIDYKVIADNITITNQSYSYYYAALHSIKQNMIRIYHTLLDDKESGALIAMLLGEKYLLDDEIKELYQESGIAHVLAISGLHVSLIGISLYHLLKRMKIPMMISTFISIFFVYSYGALTNFSLSTKRAVIMLMILLLADIFGKTYDMISSAALSALILLVVNPLQIFHAGFLLSYGAILGIAVLLPCLQQLIPIKNSIITAFLVSVSAQIMTLPFVLIFYYQLPTYGLIANMIVLPCISCLMLTAVISGIAGSISIPFGVFCIGGANYILKFYEWVCKMIQKLPRSLITIGKPNNLSLLLFAVFMAVFIWGVNRYRKKFFLAFLYAGVVILLIPIRSKQLEITMLDVGQGEAIFMETPSDIAYLIDGGSSDVKQVGKYRIQPFLLSKGIDKIDYAIITHSDSDHISGLVEMIKEGKIIIKRLVLPGIYDKDEAYQELETLAKDYQIELYYIERGNRINDNRVDIICLHPYLKFQPKSINSYSTVLSISYGEFDMLLTGDLEENGELSLLHLLQDINSGQENNEYKGLPSQSDYDVLKVAHHGSKYSTTEKLLNIIKPEISIISCGKNNRYGHPHEELLDRLADRGSDARITYKSGAIIIKTNGRKMKVSEYKR